MGVIWRFHDVESERQFRSLHLNQTFLPRPKNMPTACPIFIVRAVLYGPYVGYKYPVIYVHFLGEF